MFQRLKIYKSKIEKFKSRKQIIQWFKTVCEGIRQEYEQGASHRKLEVDIIILKKLLNSSKNIISD